MTQTQLKFNPYGIAKFDVLKKEGYVYVDKTRYIELLEQSAIRYPLIVRPCRFGKTLFTMMLQAYYDKAASPSATECFLWQSICTTRSCSPGRI